MTDLPILHHSGISPFKESFSFIGSKQYLMEKPEEWKIAA